jgi:hypothetical protein
MTDNKNPPPNGGHVPFQRNDTRANQADIERMSGSSIPSAGAPRSPYSKNVTETKVGDHRHGYRHSAPDKSSQPVKGGRHS